MKTTYKYFLLPLLSLCPSLLAAAGTESLATFDTTYDNPSTSLSSVACSNGEHGLLTKNYSVIGDLPTRNVGGSPTIKGWNDVNCGACYALTYNNSKTVNVLAIDTAVGQFNLARSVLDDLTDGYGTDYGSVEIEYELVDAGECGMPEN